MRSKILRGGRGAHTPPAGLPEKRTAGGEPPAVVLVVLSSYSISIQAERAYGWVTAFICKVTAVCANSRPVTLAPVARVMPVAPSTMPSKCAVVPIATTPAACQNTFPACAPPVRITLVAEAWVIPPATWKIQTSFGPPLSVTFVGIERTVLHR